MLSVIGATERLRDWDHTIHARYGYDLMQKANSLIPQYGSNLLSLGFEDAAYYFNGTSIGDWFGPGRYRGMFDCPSTCTLIPPEQMEVRMRAFDTNMLLLNTDRLKFEPKSLAPYLSFFNVAYQDKHGILLTRKNVNHGASQAGDGNHA
jgi:hypothetical protein